MTTLPVWAAEQIEFSYNQLEFYLPVDSLATYAQTGKVDSELGFYFQFLDEEEQAQLRDALKFSRPISPWEVSQILYTPMGEAALRNLGTLIQTESHQNGFYGMRGALIQAAADPEGLSLLGFLRHFPTESVRLDLASALQLAHRISDFTRTEDDAMQEIQSRSQAAVATEPPVDRETLPSLQDSGPLQFTRQTLMLRDSKRDRSIPTDLYVPQFNGAMPDSIPVVVYSHGYGETRSTAASFLESLASYGFVVVAPEHVGSDYQFQQDLLMGLTTDSFAASEFFDRPSDLSYVLDVLEQKNATEFDNRLNLKQVGAFGHSFGGYTVMIVGGATVDFDQLQQKCQQDYVLQSLDNSMLLECRALELSSSPEAVALLTSGQLRDPRIQAVIAANPVAGAILNPSSISQMHLPMMIYGGGDDPVAPLVPEQLQAFTQLPEGNKYLLLVNGASHMPAVTRVVDHILLPADLTTNLSEDITAFYNQLITVGVAFMQVYVAERSDYRPYLQSAYAESLDEPPFDFSLIRSFPSAALYRLLQANRSQ